MFGFQDHLLENGNNLDYSYTAGGRGGWEEISISESFPSLPLWGMGGWFKSRVQSALPVDKVESS